MTGDSKFASWLKIKRIPPRVLEKLFLEVSHKNAWLRYKISLEYLPTSRLRSLIFMICIGIKVRPGRRLYFITPKGKGKVVLMFLKMYTGLSSPKLTEQLKGNILYQLPYDVKIDPMQHLMKYKLQDDVMAELSHWVKIQQ